MKGTKIVGASLILLLSMTFALPTATLARTQPTGCDTAAWQPGPAHSPGRHLTSSVVASDGNFYAVGGIGSEIKDELIQPVDDAARYNPSTGQWEEIAPMPEALGMIALGADDQGNLYAAGGALAVNPNGPSPVTNTLYIYNITANAWSKGAPVPVESGIEAAAGVVASGKFYLLGGDDGANLLTDNSVLIYDIAKGTWTKGAPMSSPRALAAATIVDGMIYLFGGIGDNGAIDELLSYDPATDKWATLASANTSGFGVAPGLAPYGLGRLIAQDGGDENFAPSNTTHIYDIATNTWSAGPSMGSARLGGAFAALHDGRIMAYTGESVANLGELTTSSELLTPVEPCATVGMPRTGNSVSALPLALLVGLGMIMAGITLLHYRRANQV